MSTACQPASVPDRPADLAGTIVRTGKPIDETGQERYQVHVMPPQDQDCGAVITVLDTTEVIDGREDALRRRRAESILVEGAEVQVWYGGVEDSCPRQAYAEVALRTR